MGRGSKKRIAIISGAGVGVAGIAYISLAANPIAAAAIPAVLAFAACPAMCAAMGGAMWFRRRFSKRKNQTQVQQSLVVNSKQDATEAKTESTHSNKQVAFLQKQRKKKANFKAKCFYQK